MCDGEGPRIMSKALTPADLSHHFSQAGFQNFAFKSFPMASKKVNIIGGGMAGLCAGSYLQMNGYDVTIYEMNHTPGGVCTSWQRNGYTIDLCIHWLVGSGPKSSFYERWNELIDLDELRFVDHEEFYRVEDAHGNHISIFSDIDKLEKEFLLKSPEDEKEIREFISALRKLSTFDMPSKEAWEVANVWHRVKLIGKLAPYLQTLGKFRKLTCREYSEHFKNPLMKKVMMHLPDPEMGIIFGMFALVWFHNKTAGYPVGGSLNFAQKVFEGYQQLGGKIVFNARVKQILVRDKKAVGIELTNGDKFYSDFTISAADGHATIYDMLGGNYMDDKLQKFYATAKTFPSLIFVALGVKKDFTKEPHMLMLPLVEPLVIDPETKLSDLLVHNHSFDPTLAPEGGTLLTFMLETYNYRYWNSLYETNKEMYESEKKRIADAVIEILEKRFGGVKQNVEMIDVSTPVSFIHFSGNWKGSFEGWLITPDSGFKRLPHTLPGLKNFYMCGQWVAVGGGLPGVLISARDTVQIICKEDNKEFNVLKASAAAV